MPEAIAVRKSTRTQAAPSEPKISTEELSEFLVKMLRIRRFEESAFQQYQKGAVGGFCHLYAGQEAVCVGALSVLEKGDKVVTAYRDH